MLSNVSCPDLIKIGMTSRSNVNVRVDEINRQASTALPTPWVVEHTASTPHYQEAEKRLHAYFHQYRVNHQREYFKIAPEQAVSAITKMFGLSSTDGRTEIDEDGLLSEDAYLLNEPDVFRAFNGLRTRFPHLTAKARWELLREWYASDYWCQHTLLLFFVSLLMSFVLSFLIAALFRTEPIAFLLLLPYPIFKLFPFASSIARSIFNRIRTSPTDVYDRRRDQRKYEAAEEKIRDKAKQRAQEILDRRQS